MTEQLREVPKVVSPSRIQQWIAEQIVHMLVPEAVEKHVEITKVFFAEQGSTALRGAAHLAVWS